MDMNSVISHEAKAAYARDSKIADHMVDVAVSQAQHNYGEVLSVTIRPTYQGEELPVNPTVLWEAAHRLRQAAMLIEALPPRKSFRFKRVSKKKQIHPYTQAVRLVDELFRSNTDKVRHYGVDIPRDPAVLCETANVLQNWISHT